MIEGESDIYKRETRRRRALWRLAGLSPGDPAASELIQVLDETDQSELDDVCLATPISDVEEVLIQVPDEAHASTLRIVRVENIPQPWRARFLAASIGSTRVTEGFYLHDWHKFLKKWQAEMRLLAVHRIVQAKPYEDLR